MLLQPKLTLAHVTINHALCSCVPVQLPHNTNATQFWLSAHLPGDATPESISGPVLITADDIK